MKQDIHPKYQECEITCICGNVIKTRSTQAELSVSICGACHPFYTGKQKFVDTAGRIEKFQRRFSIGDGQGTGAVLRKADKKSKKQVEREARLKAETEAKEVAPVKTSKTAERRARKLEADREAAAEAAKAEKVAVKEKLEEKKAKGEKSEA